MAKQPNKPAPQRPAPIPKNWGQMTPAEKGEWRAKNNAATGGARPVGPPKDYPKSMGATPAAEPPAAEPPAAEYPPGQQPGQQLVDQEYAGQQVAEQIAASMGEMDLRAFVATILRNVADALETGVGAAAETE